MVRTGRRRGGVLPVIGASMVSTPPLQCEQRTTWLSIYTMIIDGQIPGRFVWKDDQCVAILDIAPNAPGHTLVVPRAEIDHWLDLPEDLKLRWVPIK